MRGKGVAIAMVVFLLGTLVLTVFLSQRRQIIQNQAVDSPAKLSILPSTGVLPKTVNVFLDAGTEDVVFVKTVVTFRANQIKLTAEPQVSTKLKNVVKLTTMAQANEGGSSEGRIELVAGVNPPDQPINTDNILTLNFAANAATVDPNVNNVGVDILSTATQIVALPEKVLVAEGYGAKLTTAASAQTLTFGFKIQGITAAGVTKPVTLYVGTTQFPNVNVTSNSSGVFSPQTPVSLTGVAPGTYDIFVKDPTHLRKKLGSMTIVSGANTAPTAFNSQVLKAGDFDASNVLNFLDLGSLLNQYTDLQVPVTATNRIYDVDNNNVINIDDMGLVLSNYTTVSVSGD